VSYKDQKSTWNSGVHKAIRQGSAEEEVRKHRDHVIGSWKKIRKQRRHVDITYDLIMSLALRYGTWIDEESFKKTFIKKKGKRGRHPPDSLRYMCSGLPIILRQDAGTFMLYKYLSDKKIPLKRRRRLGMEVTENTLTTSFLMKLVKMPSAGCRLCRIAREVRGESTHGLAAETHSHWHQQCRLRRNGNDSYGCLPFHLEAPA